MKVVDYNFILRSICANMGVNRQELQIVDEQNLRMMINKNLNYAWTRFNWSDLRFVQQRTPDSNNFIPFEAPSTLSMGTVYAVYLNDPTVNPTLAGPIGTYASPTGITVKNMGWNNTCTQNVYVSFQLQVPTLDGQLWSSTTNYNVGDVVVYTVSDNTSGSDPTNSWMWWYICTKANSNQPPTLPTNFNYETANNSYWNMQPIPRILAPYIILASYADWLVSSKRPDEASMRYNDAVDELTNSMYKQELQEYDQQPMSIQTHRSEAFRPF